METEREREKERAHPSSAALKELGDAHIHESGSPLLSLLIQMLISSENTLRHTQKSCFTNSLGIP